MQAKFIIEGIEAKIDCDKDWLLCESNSFIGFSTANRWETGLTRCPRLCSVDNLFLFLKHFLPAGVLL